DFGRGLPLEWSRACHRILHCTSATSPGTPRGSPMAKTNGKKGENAASSADRETTSGYFRRILKENPKLLKKGSNPELFERWLKGHPGQKEVPNNVKAILHNLKSVLRKKRRQRRAEKAQATPVASA